MKHCANAMCPFVRKHGAPSEFRDEVLVCADCGGPLVEGAVPAPILAAAATPAHAAPWGSLAVTLAVLAVPQLARAVPLPGVDEETAARIVTSPFARPVELSAFSLGLAPILYAFLCVEVAALAVPRWRPLRHGGLAGRASLLRATMLLTLAFALLQGFTHATYLEGSELLGDGGLRPRLLVAASLTAGTFVYVAVARLADRYALASGYSLLAGGVVLGELVRSAERLAEKVEQKDVDGLPFALLATLGVVVATAWLLLRRRAPGELRVPACGVAPLNEASALFSLPATLATFGLGGLAWTYPSSSTYTVVVGAFAVLFTWLMNRPARLAAFAGEGLDVTRPLLRAGLQSVAFVLGLALLPQLFAAGTAWRMPSALTLTIAVAVTLDIAAHWKARRTLGDLVPLWPEHRVYAVDAALEALERAGIAGHARGVHHRVLWQFFGPALPMVLYAPKDRVAEAERVLTRVLGGDRKSPGGPYRASA
jgi:hypothetical protein